MHLLNLDTEQADLIEAACEMMHAAMDARARRMDPNEWISKTAKMSRAKCESVLAQLELGPLMQWHQISIARRNEFLKLIRVMLDAKTEEEQAVFWNGIVGMVTYRDARAELPWHNTADEAQGL